MVKTEIIKTSFSDCFEVIPYDLTSGQFTHYNRSVHDEFEAFKTILTIINPKICLDIGSNIGSHTLFFAKYCEKVYAFEPNPDIYPILQRNIERNKVNGVAFPFGLSHSASTQNFYINNEHTGISSFVAETASKEAQVVSLQVEKGDDFIAREQIPCVDFIKIDTEGYEANVLFGLKHCILKDKPVIALEWNNDSTRMGFKDYELFKVLFSDYICFALDIPWYKHLYPTLTSKIKRGMLKNILKVERRLVPQKFVFECNYAQVFFIPERFSHIIHEFSFLPKKYVPALGELVL